MTDSDQNTTTLTGDGLHQISGERHPSYLSSITHSARWPWDRREFWRIVRMANPRVHSKAEQFIEDWIEFILKCKNLEDVVTLDARQRITDREVKLKGGMARAKGGRALELWNGAAGAAQLDFRWSSARRIVDDIRTGLKGSSHA